MAGHLPPNFFIEKLLLSGVDWANREGKIIPSGLYVDVLDILVKDDWTKNYSAGVILERRNKDELEKYAKTSIHIYNNICASQYLTAEGVAWITKEEHLGPSTVSFRNRAGNFFHSPNQNPMKALVSYLTEGSPKYGLHWVKPLLPDIRMELKKLIKSAKPEVATPEAKERINEILHIHRDHLFHCLHSWGPNIEEYLPFIRTHEEDNKLFKYFLEDHGDKLVA